MHEHDPRSRYRENSARSRDRGENREERDSYRQAYGERYYENHDQASARDSERGRGRSSEGDFFRGRDDEVERRRSAGHMSSKLWPSPVEEGDRDRSWEERDRYLNDRFENDRSRSDRYAAERSNERSFGDRYYGGDPYSSAPRGYEDDYRRGDLYMDRSTVGPYSGRGPKGYRRPDQELVEEACQRLERDGHIDATDIEVSAEDGVIRLEGSVATRDVKRRAEDCVESVYGARDVMNRLRVEWRGEQGSRSYDRPDRGRADGDARSAQGSDRSFGAEPSRGPQSAAGPEDRADGKSKAGKSATKS
jgi:hypothetical protein